MRCLEPIVNTLSLDEYGWQEENGAIVPVWYTCLQFPPGNRKGKQEQDLVEAASTPELKRINTEIIESTDYVPETEKSEDIGALKNCTPVTVESKDSTPKANESGDNTPDTIQPNDSQQSSATLSVDEQIDVDNYEEEEQDDCDDWEYLSDFNSTDDFCSDDSNWEG